MGALSALVRFALARAQHASVRLVAVLAMFVALVGCHAPPNLELRHWTLVVPSTAVEAPLELPTRIDDRLPRRRCTYLLHTRAVLPQELRGQALALSVPMLRAIATVRVNGQDVASSNEPLLAVYRASGPHRWHIPAELTADGELSIEMTVHHDWQQSAWLDTTPHLTRADTSDPSMQWAQVFADVLPIFAVGLLLGTGFASAVLYAFDRRKKGFAGLAVTSFTVSEYLLFEAGISQFLGPELEVPFMGACVTTGALSQVAMLHAHFSLPPPGRIWIVGWIVTLLIGVVSRDPFTSSLIVGASSIAFIACCVVYLLFICVRAYRAPVPAPTSMINLIAFTAFGLFLIPTACHWTGVRTESAVAVQSAVVGITLFALTQFYALSQMHTLALRTSETRQGEIALLNQELRRQLAERSARLSDALARLGANQGATPKLVHGATVDGDYIVVRELGKGAMGTAYLVNRISDGAVLAIKVLTNISDARIMARFAREAHIAARIQHPNLLSIIDIRFSSSGFMYLVMEYVDGSPLFAHRDRFGDLPWALVTLRGIAEGLAALHAAGIVHRDIKPDNILMTASDLPKIADFGISRMMDDPPGSEGPHASPPPRVVHPDEATASLSFRPPGSLLTEEGEIVGTPAYMAPELVGISAPPGPAADVFSFGVLAFELLTGQRPFETPPAVALLHGEVPKAPIGMDTIRTDIEPQLVRLIEASLRSPPELRPTSRELVEAFRAISERIQ